MLKEGRKTLRPGGCWIKLCVVLLRALGDPAPAAPDSPIAINCVQETLDVRKVMAMAGSKDSFVQISNHLDQIMPGTEPVPSIRGEPIGRRAGLKRKAADISRSTCETLAFLTTKNFRGKMQLTCSQPSAMCVEYVVIFCKILIMWNILVLLAWYAGRV